MSENQPRLFDTDPKYRKEIEDHAVDEIDYQKQYGTREVERNYGTLPVRDGADIATLAVISYLQSGGIVNADLKDNVTAEIADTVSTIIRKATMVDYEQAADPIDRNHPRYAKAATAMYDTDSQFENEQIVYDGWPIDDAYRHTSLGMITAMKQTGGEALTKALDDLQMEQRRDMVDVMSAVIELRVPSLEEAYHQRRVRSIREQFGT